MIGPVILIIQEDSLWLHYLQDFLYKSAFKCIAASNNKTGLTLLQTQSPDIVLADIGTSIDDSWQFLREARSFSKIPIIILSGIKDDRCVIHSLELGADDYIKKPFNPVELGARIEAILRRSGKKPVARESFTLDDLTIELKECSLRSQSLVSQLTRLEIVLLNYLVKNEGHVVTNEDILTDIWGAEFKTDYQLLRTAVARLKKKMNNYPKVIESIRNIPRVGYLFDFRSHSPNTAE